MNNEQTNGFDPKRRTLLKLSGLLGLGVAGAALVPFERAGAVLFGRRGVKVHETRLAMGSFLSITAIHPSRDEAQEALGLAFAEVDRLSRILSRHDASTPLAVLNRDGRLDGAPVELREVLARGMQFARQTGGAFDPTVKPILDLVQERFAAGTHPTDVEINAAAARVGADGVAIEGDVIRFAKPGMGVTLDGIAPGYVVDRLSALLAGMGIKNHLINASGDIRARGAAEGGAPWTVAIQDPAKKGNYPARIRLADGAVSTSGSYEIYFDEERLFHHIVDGRTGRSPVQSVSATVLARTSIEADALSTGLFVLGPGEGRRFIESQPGCQCFLVQRDGGISRSTGWDALG